jgi:hypothetical protein
VLDAGFGAWPTRCGPGGRVCSIGFLGSFSFFFLLGEQYAEWIVATDALEQTRKGWRLRRRRGGRLNRIVKKDSTGERVIK